MKLIFKRDQREEKGTIVEQKGIKFLLSCRAELTPEEQDLIKKFKAEEELLAKFTLTSSSLPNFLHVKDLVAGRNYECKDVASLLEVEDQIKEACKSFRTLLDVMASFGGEEVIDF